MLKRSINQLAEFFGVQQPSLARTMKELEDDTVITINGRVVKVPVKNKSGIIW